MRTQRTRSTPDLQTAVTLPHHGSEDVAPDIRIFRLPRSPSFSFEAGQHVALRLPGVAKSRTYSIASAPHEPHLEFCIERVPGGRLTPPLFEQASAARLEVGDRPKGSLRLSPGARTHLMVATVTGIAPLRSLLVDALHRGSAEQFVILHGASYADELPYRRELEALAAELPNVTYRATVSRPGEARNRGWSGDTGRVDGLAIQVAAGLDPASTHVYACGNAGMIARVRDELRGAGFGVSVEAFDD